MTEQFAIDFPVRFRAWPGAHEETGRVVGRTLGRAPKYDIEKADGDCVRGIPAARVLANDDELARLRESELAALEPTDEDEFEIDDQGSGPDWTRRIRIEQEFTGGPPIDLTWHADGDTVTAVMGAVRLFHLEGCDARDMARAILKLTVEQK